MLKTPCSPSRIAEQNFLVYLGHQWNTMQLQNQRKLFLEIRPFWHKRPRTINGYTSIYQDKTPNKKKGSGVGLYLYVNKKHVYTKFNEQSLVTEHVEIKVFLQQSHIYLVIYL